MGQVLWSIKAEDHALNVILKKLYYSPPSLLIGAFLWLFNGLFVAPKNIRQGFQSFCSRFYINMAAFILKPIF